MFIDQAKSPRGIDLAAHAVVALLFEARHKRFSGVAVAQKDRVIRRITLQEGQIVGVTSNLRSETPPYLLLALKRISAEESELMQKEGVEKKRSPKEMLGLLKRFTTEEIYNLVALLSRERLKAVLALRSGSCKMTAGNNEGAKPLDHNLRTLLDGIAAGYTKDYIQQHFPELNESNCIIFDEDRFDHITKEVNWTPEEKGVATLAKSHQTIREVLDNSLLETDEIFHQLLKLRLLNILTIETAEQREERKLATTLSADDKALKAALDTLRQEDRMGASYFDLLEVEREASKAKVEGQYNAFLQRFSKDKVLRLYPKSRHAQIERFMKQMNFVFRVLTDDRKRGEYISFLDTGEGGRFEEASNTLAVDAAIEQGGALFGRQKFTEAYNTFRQAIKQHPKDARLLSWTGIALFKTSGKVEKALELFGVALKIDPKCWEAHLRTAEVYFEMGKKKEAIPHLRHVLLLKPNMDYAVKLLERIDPKSKSVIELEAMYSHLKQMDYYSLLGVPRRANTQEIQKAYHLKTRSFHPDRFFTSADTSIKDKARAIYQRTVEAYMVLRNPGKRKEYDRQLASGSGVDADLRLKDAGDVVQRKERSAGAISNPQAKKFFDLGVTALRTGNLNSAIMNLQLALRSEPKNELIETKLREAQTKAHG